MPGQYQAVASTVRRMSSYLLVYSAQVYGLLLKVDRTMPYQAVAAVLLFHHQLSESAQKCGPAILTGSSLSFGPQVPQLDSSPGSGHGSNSMTPQ